MTRAESQASHDRIAMPSYEVNHLKLSRVFDFPFAEPTSLSLHDSTITLLSHKTGNATEHLALIPYPLTGKSLLLFLNRSANDTPGDSRYGVEADWDMPDYAKRGSQVNTRLLTLHQQLGESWEVFETHRKRFRGAIEERNNPKALPELPGGVATTERELAQMIESILVKGRDKIPFFDALSEFSERQLLDFIRASRTKHSVKPRERIMTKQQLIGRLFMRFQQSPAARRNLLDSPLWETVRDAYARMRFTSFVATQEDGTQVTMAKHREPGEPVDSPFETVFKDLGPVTAEYRFARDSQGRFIYTLVRTFSKRFHPAIHWTTQRTDSEIRRTLHVSEQPFLSFPQSDAFSPDRFPQANTLLGLLAVAYFSPDIRNAWPRGMRLPGSTYEQPIGAAQIPVLAHMRRHELESSPLLTALEQAAS